MHNLINGKGYMQKIFLPDGYTNTGKLAKKLLKDSEVVWRKKGEIRALKLFHDMATRVPAYTDFLDKHGINPKKIKSSKDIAELPLLDKDNYLRAYPKNMLCWDGKFGYGHWVISATSGSTGQPFYFPRQTSQDLQYAVTAEQYLRTNFDIQYKRTLYIVAFPMGAWIGGVFTYEAIKYVAENGRYDLSIITPGIHKTEIINAVLQLSGQFDQIIIGAYAPFLKDILDDGERAGIDWSSLNVKFIFSAEAFSENFRDYVIKKAHLKNEYRDTLNHYGTVDLGTMAHETPLSILIRRYLVRKDKLNALFPEQNRQPTLCQYNPELFYFEEVKNNLICSAYSGIPLFRYDLKDYGGILGFSEVEQRLKANGLDIDDELDDNGLTETRWQLPYVYVYERNDFTASYYAFLVYPDTIRRGLQNHDLLSHITGKFTMQVDYDDKGQQHLIVNIELAHGVKPTNSLNTRLVKVLHESLLHGSSEYPEIYKVMGEKVRPVVVLWPYEDPEYFKSGTKQKWVIK